MRRARAWRWRSLRNRREFRNGRGDSGSEGTWLPILWCLPKQLLRKECAPAGCALMCSRTSGTALSLRQQIVIVISLLFSIATPSGGMLRPLPFIQRRYDLGGGPAAPGVEKILNKYRAPAAQRLFPVHEVQRHRIHDGSVTIEQKGKECPFRQFQFHGPSAISWFLKQNFEAISLAKAAGINPPVHGGDVRDLHRGIIGGRGTRGVGIVAKGRRIIRQAG